MKCPPCTGNCRQGRECPLITLEGGRTFDSAIHEAPEIRPLHQQTVMEPDSNWLTIRNILINGLAACGLVALCMLVGFLSVKF